MKGEARYALLPAWDGRSLRGADAPPDVARQLGAQAAVTSEALFEMRGGLLDLKAGEVLQFYVKELKSQGNASDGNGNYSWTETVKNGLRQINACGGTSTDRQQYADLADATLIRMPSGAILRFRWKLDTACDFGAGANLLGFSDNEAARFLSFKLSAEDLRDWERVTKVNQGTIQGLPGDDASYPVKIQATLHGGIVQAEEETEVTLDGCSELGEGGRGRVTASGRPGGGRYRFWAEPQGMLSMEVDGAAATLTGSTPGRGTVHVEYTTPEGKTAQASRPAACVKVESINGGAPIPEIVLYDIDGKRLPDVREVPVKVIPADAADLVEYVPADPGILTAVNLGNAIALQAVREGKTTLQVRLKCSGSLGPVVAVEIVPCDKETIAKLDEMLRIATESQKHAARDFMDALDSKEFQEAADKIAGATFQLARKTAVLIIGSASGYGMPTRTIKTASEFIGKLDAVADIAEGGDVLEQMINYGGLAAEFFGDQATQTAFDVYDTIKAAAEFGEHLGNLKGQTDRMAEAAKWVEHWRRVIEDIVRRQKLCRKKAEQPPKEDKPPTDPTKPPADPKRPAPKPTKPTPKTEPVPPTPPPTGETPPGEPPVSPPPPSSPPRQVGLPYDMGDCGCGKTLGLSQNHDGLASLAAGMSNLLDCVKKFSDTDLPAYAKALEEMPAVFGKLTAAAKAGAAEWSPAFKAALPVIESLKQRIKAFDESGRAFTEGFQSCPDSMKAGVEFIKSSKGIAGVSGAGK